MLRIGSWLRIGCAVLVVGVAGCVVRGTPPIDPCKNHVIDEALSPGRDLRAVVFERRCGKPVGYSTQVAVVAADARLDDRPGNVFIAANGGRFSRGRSFVTVSWSGPTKLTVAFAPDAAVLRIERSIGAVTVAYVPHGRDAVDVPAVPPAP